MARVLIFGLRDNASLAHFYLKHDSPHEVVAFTVHEAFLPSPAIFEGLPVVPFEGLERSHAPDGFSVFAPLSYRRMNQDRARIFNDLRTRGYRLVSYVSSRATVFEETAIGDNCFVLEDNTLQPFTRVGDNVILWSGNHVGHHGTIHDHVFVSSHVVISGRCQIEPYSFLGVNSAIRDGVRIGEGSLVAMSACVVADTAPWSVNAGVPARRIGDSRDARWV